MFARAARALRDPGSSTIDARRASLGILAAFLAPALLIYAGFTIYPVIRTFYNAFFTIKPQGVVDFVGFGNFTALLFADPTFWKAVTNTALFTIVATIVDVIGGLLLALVLFARAPLAPLLRVVWFTPVLMSYVVVGIIWVWMYDYDWGLANATLRWLGLGGWEQSWLGQPLLPPDRTAMRTSRPRQLTRFACIPGTVSGTTSACGSMAALCN